MNQITTAGCLSMSQHYLKLTIICQLSRCKHLLQQSSWFSSTKSVAKIATEYSVMVFWVVQSAVNLSLGLRGSTRSVKLSDYSKGIATQSIVSTSAALILDQYHPL